LTVTYGHSARAGGPDDKHSAHVNIVTRKVGKRADTVLFLFTAYRANLNYQSFGASCVTQKLNEGIDLVRSHPRFGVIHSKCHIRSTTGLHALCDSVPMFQAV